MMISGQRKPVQKELAKNSAIRSRSLCCLDCWALTERKTDRGIGMNQGGVEDRNRRIAIIEQHTDLGAAEHKTIGALGRQPPRDIDIGRSRGIVHASDAK